MTQLNLDELVNPEEDRSMYLFTMIVATDDYPDRAENYAMRVKIRDELEQRAKKRPSPAAYSLAGECAILMKDHESEKQILEEYAKSGPVGRIFTILENYLPMKSMLVYALARIEQVRQLPTTIKLNWLERKRERLLKKAVALMPKEYQIKDPTLKDIIDETTRQMQDLKKDLDAQNAELEARIQEDIKWLPKEYRPEVVNPETYVDAFQRFMKERPKEYEAMVQRRAKGDPPNQ